MRAISRARWDALAVYCRKPLARALMRELAWFEAGDERVLATLIVDTDGEFSGIILARDLLERFRWVGATNYFDTPEQALTDLHREILSMLPNLGEQRRQGDESGKVIDFSPRSSMKKSYIPTSAKLPLVMGSLPPARLSAQ